MFTLYAYDGDKCQLDLVENKKKYILLSRFKQLIDKMLKT